MDKDITTYRIRTKVGETDSLSIPVSLMHSYDTINILSLNINQKNAYNIPASLYGVILGRVEANGGFGIPNAKVSIFVPFNGNTYTADATSLYIYTSTSSKDENGIRYNILPNESNDECHQNVGTFPSKRFILDNNGIIDVYDTYYTYTTVTNNAGDYCMYGIPTGNQTVHCDVDISDCGMLSQKPRDMVYKGYNIEQFDSPNKFKNSTNLNNLSQIYSQDKGVMIYPFWGDTTDDSINASITRCDIDISYKFEPTCIFMGSVVTDSNDNAITKNCRPSEKGGKMSDMIGIQGNIEMIRKTANGNVEEFPIKGNALINENGVWCYQIPMNLDYVITDEFGNIVPSESISKGIATRTRVRFRVSLSETTNDGAAKKRARYLIPNNPKINDDNPQFKKTKKIDYDFGTNTDEESFRDLFWNNVYSVKNYIPRLQKNKISSSKRHIGIKMVNHAGDNNPMPYNSLFVKLPFTFRLSCALGSTIINVVSFLNRILYAIGNGLLKITTFLNNFHNITFLGIGKIVSEDLLDSMKESCVNIGITLSGLCDDGNVYFPFPDNFKTKKIKTYRDNLAKLIFGNNSSDNVFTSTVVVNGEAIGEDNPWVAYDNGTLVISNDALQNCMENGLAQDSEITSFNFYNDWINGTLYFPLWFRRVQRKHKFLGMTIWTDKDKYCSSNRKIKSGILHTGALKRDYDYYNSTISPISAISYTDKSKNKDDDNSDISKRTHLHKKLKYRIQSISGYIQSIRTIYDQTVYYYKPCEYDTTNLVSNDSNSSNVKIFFATDIILLGNLNSCNDQGIPMFFENLDGTTYNMPPDLMEQDYETDSSADAEDDNEVKNNAYTDMTGADWGNTGIDQYYKNKSNSSANEILWKDAKSTDGGLFYNLKCNDVEVIDKSIVNLSRICEYGVGLDAAWDSNEDNTGTPDMIPDGVISYDDIYDSDGRSMFATMNYNNLRTKINEKNGFPIYDFSYMYPNNFDGSLFEIMQYNWEGNNKYNFPHQCPIWSYVNNYKLENGNESYFKFRYKDRGVFYTTNDSEGRNRVPVYDNSFYFYFGIKDGKTAIDEFRKLYYMECNSQKEESSISINFLPNSWCSEVSNNVKDGYISFDLTEIENIEKIVITDVSNENNNWTITGFSYSTANRTIVMGVTPQESSKFYIASQTIQSLEDDGYIRRNISTDTTIVPSLSNTMLPNGTYIIIITDTNGDSYKKNIELYSQNITFDINSVDFKLSNNEIYSTYTKYDDVAKIGENNQLSNRTFNGYIKIYNVVMDGDSTDDYFRIDIGSTELPSLPTGPYSGSSLIVDKSENRIEGTNGYLGVASDGAYLFGVPYGGVKYNITSTQLCGKDILTNNTYTITELVKEATPTQFLINGIDYELIKEFSDGFIKTIDNNGYYVLNTGGINSIKGWNELSNIGTGIKQVEILPSTYHGSNLEEMVNALNNTTNDRNSNIYSPYTWTDSYRVLSYKNNPISYTVANYDNWDNLEQSIFLNYVNYVISSRINIANIAKSTFWINSPNGTSLTLSYNGENTPYKYIMMCQEQGIDNNGNNVVTSSYVRLVDFSLSNRIIGEITIPTISVSNGNTANNVNNNIICTPYYVAEMDGSKNTLPVAVGNGIDGFGFLNNQTTSYAYTNNFDRKINLSHVFGIHFIDKIFKVSCVVWTPFYGIPKYINTTDITNAKVSNGDGIFAGYVDNGTPSNVDLDTKYVQQTITDNSFGLYTITQNSDGTTNEDGIPTRRMIYNNDIEHNPYRGYVHNNNYASFSSNQYFPISYGANSITIIDKNENVINKQIYGDISFGFINKYFYAKYDGIPSSPSLYILVDTNYILNATESTYDKVRTEESTQSGETVIATIKYYDKKIPYVSNNSGTDTSYIVLDNDGSNVQSEYSFLIVNTDSSAFNTTGFDYPVDNLLYGRTIPSIFVYQETDPFIYSIDGITIEDLERGIIKINNTDNLPNKAFYIIKYKDNKTVRTISPVIDMNPIRYTISVDERGNSIITILPQNNIYARLYNFTLIVNGISSVSNTTTTVTMNINAGEYTNINLLSISMVENVYIIDIIGIRHKLTI